MSIKYQIEEALFELAIEKPLDKISVKDIVTHCGISRQTFYYHFQDMLEVVEWSFSQKMEKLLQDSLRTEVPEEAIHFFVRSLADGQTLLRELYFSSRRDLIERQFIQATRTYLEKLLFHKAENTQLGQPFVNFGLDFYATGICQYLLVHSTETWDLDKLEKWFLQLFKGEFSIL